MNTKSELVTIVTPCFNGEEYLRRYFCSILSQTYGSIQLIFVDDGSSDATFEIASSFRAAIEERGYSYVLLRQKNSGQAAAINLALSHVAGAYITWIDSDDVMYDTCIERKVSALEHNPDAGFVCSQVNVVDETDLDKIIDVFKRFRTDDPWLFDSLITEQDGYCCNIAYMARTKTLFDAIPLNGIYESRSGQNWQLLLPLAYTSKCTYIEEPLASCVVRKGSHSHSCFSAQQSLQRTYDLEDILCHVISDMHLMPAERTRIESYVGEKYLPQRFRLAVEIGDYPLLGTTKRRLDTLHGKSLYRECLATASRFHCGQYMLKLLDGAYMIKHRLMKLFARSGTKPR